MQARTAGMALPSIRYYLVEKRVPSKLQQVCQSNCCVCNGASEEIFQEASHAEALLDPDGHFVVVHAKVVRQFMDHCAVDLIADAFGVVVAVGLDGFLIDDDAFRLPG